MSLRPLSRWTPTEAFGHVTDNRQIINPDEQQITGVERKGSAGRWTCVVGGEKKAHLSIDRSVVAGHTTTNLHLKSKHVFQHDAGKFIPFTPHWHELGSDPSTHRLCAL